MIETKPPSAQQSKEKKITGLDIFFRKQPKVEAHQFGMTTGLKPGQQNLQKFKKMEWFDAASLQLCMLKRASNDDYEHRRLHKQFANGPRRVRVVNIEIWDSCLAFENYSFKGDPKVVNPRNPLKMVPECN